MRPPQIFLTAMEMLERNNESQGAIWLWVKTLVPCRACREPQVIAGFFDLNEPLKLVINDNNRF